MPGDRENFVLTDLRRIAEVDGLRADVAEVKQRVGFLEEQYASISRRVDRIGGDVEQIMTRLDLVTEPANQVSLLVAVNRYFVVRSRPQR